MEMKRLAGFFVNRNMYVNGDFRFMVDAVTLIPHTKLCVVSGGNGGAHGVMIIPRETLANHCYDKEMTVSLMNERGWTNDHATVKFW